MRDDLNQVRGSSLFMMGEPRTYRTGPRYSAWVTWLRSHGTSLSKVNWLAL